MGIALQFSTRVQPNQQMILMVSILAMQNFFWEPQLVQSRSNLLANGRKFLLADEYGKSGMKANQKPAFLQGIHLEIR